MYVYLSSEPGLWTVGFYSPDGEWHPKHDTPDKNEAAKRVAWLNGGSNACNTHDDLLAVCQDAAEHLDGFVVDEGAGAVDYDANALHRRLCAAIAKAKGE